MHEEFRGGTLEELVGVVRPRTRPKGEITLVLEGAPASSIAPPDPAALRAQAASLLAEGLSRKDVVRQLTESSGLGRNEVYRLVMELP